MIHKNGKIILSVLLGGLALISCGTDKMIPLFNGERAFEYLVAQTEFGPRNPGSPGHRKGLDYIVGELTKYAPPNGVKIQPFSFTDTIGDSTYTLTNIIASFNLSPKDDRRIMLAAHWDTRPFADRDPDVDKQSEAIIGANDGASGVAVLLEIANILSVNMPKVGVDIVFFDGEDFGRSEVNGLDDYFLGAKHFADTKGDYRPEFAVLVDMVGSKNAKFYMEGFSLEYAPNLVHRIWDKAQELGMLAFVHENGPKISDDHVILNKSGIPTVNIIDINNSEINYQFWHTTSDTPEQCSPETLRQVGTMLLYLIYG